LDAKVTRLQIRLPNYVKTHFVPLGDEGLSICGTDGEQLSAMEFLPM